MQKICVITGGTGYVGSHLAEYLVGQGWQCHLLVREKSNLSMLARLKGKVTTFSYRDQDELNAAFRKIKPRVVFHLAAAVITRNEGNHIPALIQSNVLLGTQILEAMTHAGCTLLISTGTYWQSYNTEGYNPLDLYAATKEAFEKIIQYYVDAHGLRAITLRLFDIYGEDDVRPKLWNALREIAGTGRSIALSPAEQRLDLTHISDVVAAYETAFCLLDEKENIQNEVYDVSSGHFHTLREWVNAFMQAAEKPILVEFGGKPYREREMMQPVCRKW